MGQGGGEEEGQSEEGRTRQHGAIVASGCCEIVTSDVKIAETIRSVWGWPAVKIEEWLILLQ